MKFCRSLFATLLFLTVAVCTYYVHVTFLRVDVVLYSAVADGALATGMSALVLFGWRYFAIFSSFEKLQLTLIWLLSGYILAISVPTIIDRSLSFYILEKIQQRGGGIKLASFEEVFTKEYVKEHRLVDVRLTEQQQSGTITIQDGCVKLTERGVQLASFSRFFRKQLLPKKRLLMGKYTDELTDPFRNSQKVLNYECQ